MSHARIQLCFWFVFFRVNTLDQFNAATGVILKANDAKKNNTCNTYV